MVELKQQGDFFERSREFWEKRYGRSLSNEEVRQIIANSSSFMNLLLRWNASEKAKTGSEKGCLPEEPR